MNHSQVITANGEVLTLSSKPLGEGAEGKVFEIFAPLERQNWVVKIFHSEQLNKEKHLKINYLKENKPSLSSMVWVEDLVFQENKFVGYLMPKSQHAFDLSHLSNLILSPKLPSEWHLKYDRQIPENLLQRAKICKNIAQIVKQIHQSNRYVIADLKPENIRVNLQGEVHLLDIDSIEIVDNQQVVFKPYKITPEYCPPELKQITLGSQSLTPDWDNFALAVIFYKILLGLHPYAVSAKGELAELNTYEQKIQSQLFAFGSQVADIEMVPEAHQNFWALPTHIQELFRRAFDSQNQRLCRPSAEEWEKAFLDFHPNYTKYKNPIPLITKPLNIKPKKSTYRLKPEREGIAIVTFLALIVILSFIFNPTQESHLRQEQLARNAQEQALLLAISEKEILVDDLRKALALRVYDQYQWEALKNGASRLKYVIKSPTYQKGSIDYQTIAESHQGIRVYKKDGYYGLMNENAVEITDNLYQYLEDYSDEGLILAKRYNFYGYITAKGKTIIPFQFAEAKPFKNGIAEVKFGGEWIKINKLGNKIAE